ncbi:hypothetical protein EV356DRAFT_581318 [Viridothelium virens]|uniref:Uncharacterized protein n=1 Tax=Viridothelium virens TaxID=1048519 RepID=A0A6A6GSQ3_VIRVR|nr:hypothetical protein EV356DRAFT_581318 [Viridothelium virens]
MRSPHKALISSADTIEYTSGNSKAGFSAEWASSDASFLNPSRPLKVHRAWERQPHAPFAQQSRFRKVWRRYSLKAQRSLPGEISYSSPSLSQQSPRKVTKKLCLTDACERYRGAATRWEKDGRTRARKAQVQDTPDPLEDQPQFDPQIYVTIGKKESESEPETSAVDDVQEDNNRSATIANQRAATTEILSEPQLCAISFHKTGVFSPESGTASSDTFDLGTRSGEDTEAPFERSYERETSIDDRQGMKEFGEYVSFPSKVQIALPDEMPQVEQDFVTIDSVSPKEDQWTTDVKEVQRDGIDQVRKASIRPAENSKDPIESINVVLDWDRRQSPDTVVTQVLLGDTQEPNVDICISTSDKNAGESLPPEAVVGEKGGDQTQNLDLDQFLRPTRMQTAHLDSDTAILQAYLNRKQAIKAENSQADSITRRTSLSHRRDSDLVRQALTSPRMVLEDKDVNSPSPKKSKDAVLEPADHSSPVKDTSEARDLGLDYIQHADQAGATPARRSRRNRSRIPPPSSGTSVNAPTSIAVRSGATPVILARSDAQEMAIVTRSNTRKNKGGALLPKPRLQKLKVTVAAGVAEASSAMVSQDDESRQRSIVWADPLVQGSVLSRTGDIEESSDIQQEDGTEKTPKLRTRRLRGPNNGTPAKGLLTRAELPHELEPVALEQPKSLGDARPRRLPSPKKLKFTMGNDGKENRSATPKKKSGIPVGAGPSATRASGKKRAVEG